jgi:LPXTG-motif cell wall-anchored protein
VAFDFDVSVLNNIDYQGWQVVIELPVIITTVSYDEVTNEAWLFPNEASWETGEGPGGPGGGDPIPTDDDPTYRLGNITFKKVDASAGTPLTGVTFAVYTKLQSNGQPDESSRVTIDPDGAGGQPAANTWTSDGQGLITLAGLGLSNWDPNADNGIADGKSGNWITNPSLYSKYYLVEVATLSNYSLLATPVEFFVTDNSANPGVPVDANSDGKPDTTTDEPGPMAVDQTVKNAKLNGGFALPLTGGTGLASLTALALLLGGSGIALLVVRRRRERTAQTTAAL